MPLIDILAITATVLHTAWNSEKNVHAVYLPLWLITQLLRFSFIHKRRDEILTLVADSESVGAGARCDEWMSVKVGAERCRRTAGNGDSVHAVRNSKNGVWVAPVGRPWPLHLRSHWLAVKHYISSVGSLGDDGQKVVEIDTVLQHAWNVEMHWI